MHFLRETLGLTGTHIGCETTICGACTVHLDGRAVKSCTLFAVQADGRRVTTVEGLAKDAEHLHPVQIGFWEEHGLQCGYCTPGMIMTTSRAARREPEPERSGDPLRDRGQHLPLHRLSADRERRAARGARRAGRSLMPVRPISVGERIKRREDPRLIRGLATYTDDIKLHGMLHAAFVRSDYAAGKIRKIDLSRRARGAGVIAAYTFDDLRGKVGRTPCVARPEPGRDVEHPLLADGFVRYVGQPVAVVIAEDRYVARDAALDVTVDIDPARPVVDLRRRARARRGARCTPTTRTTSPSRCPRRTPPKSTKLFQEADGVVQLELVNQKVAPVSMEPRAVLAHWDEGPQRLTVWTSTQVPHLVKQQLAQCLGISEVRIRVVAPEVGGGFGCKIPVYPEECLLPWISRQLRRPIKWAETRTENLLEHDSRPRARAPASRPRTSKDGELARAARPRAVRRGRLPVASSGRRSRRSRRCMMPGCYKLRGLSVEVVCLYTNTMATDAYRGAGRPEAAYTRRASHGRDRRRAPGSTPSTCGAGTSSRRAPSRSPRRRGAVYDSGDYGPTLDKALARFDYAGAQGAPRASARAGPAASASASRRSPRSAAWARAPAHRRSSARAAGSRARCASSRPAT